MIANLVSTNEMRTRVLDDCEGRIHETIRSKLCLKPFTTIDIISRENIMTPPSRLIVMRVGITTVMTMIPARV